MGEAKRIRRFIQTASRTNIRVINIPCRTPGVANTPRTENLPPNFRTVKCEVQVSRTPACDVRDSPDDFVVRGVVTPAAGIRDVTIR